MSQLSYAPGSIKKDFVCVEVAVAYSQTSPWTPSGSGVQGIFTNTIGETIAMTLNPAAGGTITPSGFNFILGGASTNYNIVATFNKKYSGSITFSGTSIDNSIASGVDKFCNGSIENFDILLLK